MLNDRDFNWSSLEQEPDQANETREPSPARRRRASSALEIRTIATIGSLIGAAIGYLSHPSSERVFRIMSVYAFVGSVGCLVAALVIQTAMSGSEKG